MTKDEALTLALEALSPDPEIAFWYGEKIKEQALTAIKEALAAPVQEQALPEFFAALEYNSPDWDVFACVYRCRADATPELVHREQLPRQAPAAQPAYTKEDIDRAFSAGIAEGEKLGIEAQPAPVQEPVAVIGSDFQLLYCREDWAKGLKVGDTLCLYTPPAAPVQEKSK